MLSKATAILVQVAGVPLILVACGQETYATYLLLVSTLAWLSMANCGVGPGLTVRYGAALGSADVEDASQLFNLARVATVAMFIIYLTLGLGALLALSLARGRPSATILLNAGFDTLIVVFVCIALQSVATVPEAIRLADGSAPVTSIAVCGGNLSGLVVAGGLNSAGVTQLWPYVLAIWGFPVFTRSIVNTLYLLRGPWGFLPLSHLKGGTIRLIVRDGAWALAVSAASYATHQAVLAFNPFLTNTADVSAVGTCLNLFMWGAGLASLAGQPVMAYVARLSGGAAQAARSLLRRTLLAVGAIGIAVYVCCETVLPPLIELVFHGELTISHELFRWMGVYYVFAMVELALHSYLAGVAGVRVVAKIYVLRGTLSYVAAIGLTGLVGNTGVFVGPLLCVLTLSLPLYLLTVRRNREKSACVY